MVFRESETIELKEVVVDDIKKEIIAFANCDGGKLYIGVRDDGTVVGLDNPDRTALQISNMARVLRCSCIMRRLRRMGKRLLQLIFSEERIVLII